MNYLICLESVAMFGMAQLRGIVCNVKFVNSGPQVRVLNRLFINIFPKVL